MACATVGSSVVAHAGDCTVTISVDDAVELGSLQIDVDYAAAPGEFRGSGSDVVCQALPAGVFSAFNDIDVDRELKFSMISLGGFSGPLDVVVCTFDPVGPVSASAFGLTVVDSSNTNNEPVPFPAVSARLQGCGDPPPTTTTTTTSSTSTSSTSSTSMPALAGNCAIRFDLVTDVELGALQFDVDYAMAPGAFVGEGEAVDCTVHTPSTFAANNHQSDVELLRSAFLFVAGFDGPGAVMTCGFASMGPVAVEDFAITVTDSSGPDATPVAAAVAIGSLECSAVTTTLPSTTTTTTTTSTSSTTTTTVPVCGDGVQQFGEACDLGIGNSDVAPNACRSDCTLPSCGDGVTDNLFAEACDAGAGNSDSTPDACRSDCTLPVCGDGVTDPGNGEQCDDANASNSDACVAGCVVAVCGDGFERTGVEECDSGDANSDSTPDACRTDCSLPVCGDGVVDPGNAEQCDDGNGSDTDACVGECLDAVCGDGFVRDGVEDCDDGNTSDTDACVGECTDAVCGDGFVRDGVEDCDDANSANDDACIDGCVAASCGDGFVQAGVEDCDDGNDHERDGCTGECLAVGLCGDATNDDRVTTTDALTILKAAVGQQIRCPHWICNVNGNSTGLAVTTSDALVALANAVAMEIPRSCPDISSVRVCVATEDLIGSLQIRVDYDGPGGSFGADKPDCEVLSDVGSTFFEFSSAAGADVSAGFISQDGFAAETADTPRGPECLDDLFECAFTPASSSMRIEHFGLTVIAADTPAPLPIAEISAEVFPY